MAMAARVLAMSTLEEGKERTGLFAEHQEHHAEEQLEREEYLQQGIAHEVVLD